MKQYYSTGEAAERLGLSRVTVFRKIKEGKIKAEKIGRNFVIPASEIETATAAGAKERIAPDEIDQAVKRAVKDYGQTLKQLGRE